MNCIQAYNVCDWEILDSPVNGEAVFTYLVDKASVIMRLGAALLTNQYDDFVKAKLCLMRRNTEIVYSASGKFYVNGLLWEIYTDELSTGDYRSYLFTEFNHHCIVGCSDLNGTIALVAYQKDLKALLRSIALVKLLNESATLELDGASVTVYSQTDLSVNENSNQDALFFLSNERYVVFYKCRGDLSASFNKRSEFLIHECFDDDCKISKVNSSSDCIVYYISRNGIVSYCTYAEVECNGVILSVVSHDRTNRGSQLLEDFRIEVSVA